MEARRRSGRGAGLQGGGTVGGPTDVHKIQEFMCNISCSGVSVGVVGVFFVFSSCFVPFPACQRSITSSFWFHNVLCLLSLFLDVSIIVTFLVQNDIKRL